MRGCDRRSELSCRPLPAGSASRSFARPGIFRTRGRPRGRVVDASAGTSRTRRCTNAGMKRPPSNGGFKPGAVTNWVQGTKACRIRILGMIETYEECPKDFNGFSFRKIIWAKKYYVKK